MDRVDREQLEKLICSKLTILAAKMKVGRTYSVTNSLSGDVYTVEQNTIMDLISGFYTSGYIKSKDSYTYMMIDANSLWRQLKNELS